jgi:hypothetical protein
MRADEARELAREFPDLSFEEIIEIHNHRHRDRIAEQQKKLDEARKDSSTRLTIGFSSGTVVDIGKLQGDLTIARNEIEQLKQSLLEERGRSSEYQGLWDALRMGLAKALGLDGPPVPASTNAMLDDVREFKTRAESYETDYPPWSDLLVRARKERDNALKERDAAITARDSAKWCAPGVTWEQNSAYHENRHVNLITSWNALRESIRALLLEWPTLDDEHPMTQRSTWIEFVRKVKDLKRAAKLP